MSQTLLPFSCQLSSEQPRHADSWIVDCGAESNGFGLISEDKELSFKDLPPYDPKDIQVLPLVRFPFPIFWIVAIKPADARDAAALEEPSDGRAGDAVPRGPGVQAPYDG